MNRKEFLELSSVIIGGLACEQFCGLAAAAAPPPEEHAQQDRRRQEDYLALGLAGMARATGWFDAHWGAAVLAGHYLSQESDLGMATRRAIQRQLDAMIRLRPSQFEPFAADAVDEASIERISQALWPAVQGGLRAHGHAVIFAALSLRALRQAPHLAHPKLIDGLCELSRQIAKIKPQPPPTADDAYGTTQALVQATFDSLARFKEILGHPRVRRPNFTHMVTHTEAILTLESLGYRELASAGHAGHRAHISAAVPSIDPGDVPQAPQATLENLMSQSFWQDEQNLARWNKAWNEFTNPNGYWVAFGHLFKVLYSFHRLMDRIEDQDQLQLCSRILLERYVNPEVRGG